METTHRHDECAWYRAGNDGVGECNAPIPHSTVSAGIDDCAELPAKMPIYGSSYTGCGVFKPKDKSLPADLLAIATTTRVRLCLRTDCINNRINLREPRPMCNLRECEIDKDGCMNYVSRDAAVKRVAELETEAT